MAAALTALSFVVDDHISFLSAPEREMWYETSPPGGRSLPIAFDYVGHCLFIVVIQLLRFQCANIRGVDHIGCRTDSRTIHEAPGHSIQSVYGDQMNAQHGAKWVACVVDGADCVVEESRRRSGAVEEISMNIKAYFSRRQSD